jgi:hypothetical protein
MREVRPNQRLELGVLPIGRGCVALDGIARREIGQPPGAASHAGHDGPRSNSASVADAHRGTTSE